MRTTAPRLSLLLVLTLTGCSTPTRQDSFAPVQAAAHSRVLQDTRWLQSDAERQTLQQQITVKLRRPVSMDDAVQIAVWNNRGLQAQYARLGIALADLQTVSGWPDLGLGLSRLHSGGALEINRSLSFSLLELLTRPLARRQEQLNLQQTRLELIGAMLTLAHNTRRAWIAAVAARELAQTARESNQAAELTRDLVERLTQAGNLSRLDLLREQALYADTQASVASAEQQVVATQAELTALMGLWGRDSNYTLPDQLPPLPAQPIADQQFEAIALQQRSDVQAALADNERLASSLGLTRNGRFIDLLELGYQHNSVSGQPAQSGYELNLRVPLFSGSARQAKAQMLYQQSLDQTADIAIRARAEVRASYTNYRLAYDTAHHYQTQVMPVHAQLADEILLRYNGMLLSVLDLINSVHDQAQARQQTIQAQRDFWLADTALSAALGGTPAPKAEQ